MSEFAEKYIRTNAQQGRLDFSEHAQKRMNERCILIEDIINAICNGKVIEIQNFEGEDLKILFQEATDKKPEFYVVVAATDIPVVATVARVKSEVWAYINGVMKRRLK